MVLFNYSTKEITAKVVYYGPGLCGKTSNLQFIYDDLPQTINKGKMLSLATKTDRTLFFDFLPIDLGTIRGMRTRLQLYTVPGQVFYNTTRKLVLKGADGVVFVADSQKTMLDANIESFRNLEQNLAEHGMTLSEMPLVIQFNKRDLPEVLSIDELNAALNKRNAPIYEAVATTGIGVHETLKACTRLVLNSLKTRYAEGDKEKRDEKIRAAEAAVIAAKKLPSAGKRPEAAISAPAAASTPARTQAPPLQQAAPSQQTADFGESFEGDLVPLEDDLLTAETSLPELEADLSTLVPDTASEHVPASRFAEKIAKSEQAPPAPSRFAEKIATLEQTPPAASRFAENPAASRFAEKIATLEQTPPAASRFAEKIAALEQTPPAASRFAEKFAALEQTPPAASRFAEKAPAASKGMHAEVTTDEALFEILDIDASDEVLEDVFELEDETPSSVIFEEPPSFHAEHAVDAPRPGHAPSPRSWEAFDASGPAHPMATEQTAAPAHAEHATLEVHATHEVRSALATIDGPSEIRVPIALEIGGQTIMLSLRLSLTVDKEAGKRAVSVGVSS